MAIWSAEIKELEKLYASFKGQFPELEKELEQLIKFDDPNVILLYSRRCLEVILTDLCECELKRSRGTEPLKGIIDKLHKERKVPDHIATSMHGLNDLSTYGTHPKDFDTEQVKPVLVNLDIIIKWYLKHKETTIEIKAEQVEENLQELKSTEDIKKSSTITKKMLTGIISATLAVILIVFLVLYLSNKELEKSIAVLPFINESPVDSNKHFINGVMEEILNNLQTLKEFRVLARTSTSQYQDFDRPTIPEIAKKLGVSYIVEGSGQKYGNTFTLRVQLIRAKRKETHIWSNTYNEEIREVRDYVRIQSEVAQAIAAELKVAINPEEKQLIEKVPTTNLTAYDYYQRGRDEHIKYWINPNDSAALKRSNDLYHEALKYDSTFALAYSGLAKVYWDKHYWETILSENFLDSVLILCNVALKYDNKLSDAYAVRGDYYREMEKTEQALADYDKAVKYNPNDYIGYYGKGELYFDDDLLKAIDNLQRAASRYHGLELSLILERLATAYGYAGFLDKAKDILTDVIKLTGDSIRKTSYLAALEAAQSNYEKAIEYYERLYAMDSTNKLTQWNCGYYNLESGRYKESLKYFEKWLEGSKTLSEGILFGMHRVGLAYSYTGNKVKADYYFDKQINICNKVIELGRVYGPNSRVYYDLAAVYAFRSERDKAYENLRLYNRIQSGRLMNVLLIKNDPLFSNIRKEPEFQQIVKDVEAKYQAEHERVRKWLEEQGML